MVTRGLVWIGWIIVMVDFLGRGVVKRGEGFPRALQGGAMMNGGLGKWC